MRKPALIIGILFVVVVILSVIRIFVSNSLATSGIALAKMEDDLASYKTENSFLSEKFFIKSSLTNIASEAALLGFVENKSSFVLLQPLPLAVKR